MKPPAPPLTDDPRVQPYMVHGVTTDGCEPVKVVVWAVSLFNAAATAELNRIAPLRIEPTAPVLPCLPVETAPGRGAGAEAGSMAIPHQLAYSNLPASREEQARILPDIVATDLAAVAPVPLEDGTRMMPRAFARRRMLSLLRTAGAVLGLLAIGFPIGLALARIDLTPIHWSILLVGLVLLVVCLSLSRDSTSRGG